MFFCCHGFPFDTIGNHIGPEGNMLPAFRYGEGADWFSFDYEGFWCSSSSVSFIWSLLNEVFCVDVIACRTVARSCRNLTLVYPWLTISAVALGKSLTLSVSLCLSGYRTWFPLWPLETGGSAAPSPVWRMLCSGTAPLLHLCCPTALPDYSVTHSAVVFLMCSYRN